MLAGRLRVAHQMFDALPLRKLSPFDDLYFRSNYPKMALLLKSRTPTRHLSPTIISTFFLPKLSGFCSSFPTIADKGNIGTSEEVLAESRQNPEANYSQKLHLSPLFNNSRPYLDGAYNVQLLDDDTWKVSSCLARAWQELDIEAKGNTRNCDSNVRVDDDIVFPDDLDVDEIDNMRIRGNLFYKLDRDSKEFEEYNFDFHRRGSSKKKVNSKGKKVKEEFIKKKQDDPSKDCNPVSVSAPGVEKVPQIVKNGRVYYCFQDNDKGSAGVEKKKVRTPTFNQLTGPYHEPFCLDIFISKASIRACVIHRVTSKVVAVAHSISKDLKFDLASTRNAAACAAVGEILAHRALADDIHDVVYTPRKGDKLEGKLLIVVHSLIDSGVNVKVKLKQRKQPKAALPLV